MVGFESPEQPNRRENKQAPEKHRDLNYRLDIILAAMITSALTWEQDHKTVKQLRNSLNANIIPPKMNTKKEGEENNGIHK